eukprot:g20959.t1
MTRRKGELWRLLELLLDNDFGKISRVDRDFAVKAEPEDVAFENDADKGLEIVLEPVPQYPPVSNAQQIVVSHVPTLGPAPPPRRSGIPILRRAIIVAGRAPSKPLAPRDISGDPFDPNNIVSGPRTRKTRPAHHSAHHVTLAVEMQPTGGDALLAPDFDVNNDGENEYTRKLLQPERTSVGSTFPPAFTRLADALPWVLLLKTDDMLINDMGNVRVFTGLQFKRFDNEATKTQSQRPHQQQYRSPPLLRQLDWLSVFGHQAPDVAENLADLFTKALPTPQFRYLANQFTVPLDSCLKEDEDSIPESDDATPTTLVNGDTTKQKSD